MSASPLNAALNRNWIAAAAERERLERENADLRAKLEEARKDAERYRWLRAAEVIPFNIMHIEYMGEVLDARIDAAKEERSEQLSADGLRISACSVDAVDREERDAQG